DGLPLYRIEKELARVGVELQRTTLASWMIKTAERLSPLYLAMQESLLGESVIHGDETTLQVLKEPDKPAQSQSYLWAYTSPAQSTTPVVLFDYQPGREHTYPKAFLNGYQGTVMTDGYSAWRMLGACSAQVQRCPRPEPEEGRTAQTGLELYPEVVCRGEKGKILVASRQVCDEAARQHSDFERLP
ncbi:hypothetical protein BZJ21_15430, partial [Salinivibrio costicola subsp. alcaliphilus]